MTAFRFLKMSDTPAERQFFAACERGDLEQIRKLVADGVNPKNINKQDSLFRETPLHTALR